jgi:TolB-like protein/Flp pilus assembly protein TadD
MSDPSKAVFLSYASQDADAARRIADALRQAGTEVWFDRSELVGGDAWDQKIRKQIKDCALFVPVISANTNARLEGYFRREWRMAVDRMHDMDDDMPFLVPVVIDDTTDAAARVPERFRERQWTRLPGGETPPPFCERVKKLSGPGLAVGAGLPRDGSEESSQLKSRGKPTPTKRPLVWLTAGILIVVTIAALAFWWPYFAVRPALKSPTEAPGAVTPGANVAVSDVDRLLGQIWDLVYHHGMARAELEAADQLCRRAVELDVTKADVWAAWAHVHTWLIFHRFDETDTRRLAAQDSAARAMRLAPHSFEARLAQAMFWLRGKGASETQVKESELALRALLREKPEDSRVQFLLGYSLLKEAQTWDEGVELLKRSAGNPQMASVAWMEIGWSHYFGARFTEADRAIEQSIAAGAYWNNCALKTRLALQWHGDLAAAKTWLEKLPPADLQHDFVVAHQFMLYMWRREPQRVIPLLQNHPREWLSSNPYHGPKSLLLGLARRMAGQETAAGNEFRLALALIEARLRDNPNDGDLLSQKAEVLFYLGDRPVADAACRQVREISRLNLSLRVLFDSADSVIEFLESSFDRPDLLQPSATAASFRLDPLYDTIRKHPRFQTLIARAEASPLHTPAPLSPLPAASPTSVADPKSVAVLAFANLSDDKGNEYFSDGISEELLNVLAKVPGLKVSARTSAFYFKGKQVPIADIAKQLGVAYVVEGSVRKSGDRVRITAQLIKAQDGFHLWSENFDRELKDIFAVQDEIAGLIAKNLSLKIGLAAPSATAVNPEVLQLYFEARQLWSLRYEKALTLMEELLTRALALDPRFAPAEAGLAQVWVTRAFVSTSAPRHVAAGLDGAVAHAQKAIALDPGSAEAHEALGTAALLRGDLAAAETALTRATTLNPNYPMGWNKLGWVLVRRGRAAEALEKCARARELDPLVWSMVDNHGWALLHVRRHAEAAAMFATSRTLPVSAPITWANGALALLFAGRNDEALGVARVVVQGGVKGEWNRGLRDWSDGVAAWVLAEAGARDEAVAIVERLLAGPEAQRFGAGFALVALGREEEACAALTGTPSHLVPYLWLLHQRHEALADDARFQKLLAQLNATEDFQAAGEALARTPAGPEGKR